MMLLIFCSLAHLVMYGVQASECPVPLVEDICVYGNDKSFIAEGAPFQFFTYNPMTKTNVYFCEECGGSTTVSSVYLYGSISEASNNYYWKIGPDYQSSSSWSYCYVGDESLGPNYTFDINDCLDANNWRTYDGSVDVWNDDDMSLSTCNAICYESDVYPEINTAISKSIESKITASTAWNGDVYFDFSIYEEDCMNPQISFDYEVIDHDETYENIEIFDNNGMIIATCNGLQNCGTFSSCVSDYSIDDVIQMNQTYSISIHQTADVDNFCDDYIFNAVLTLTCGSDNPHNIISSTSSSSTDYYTLIFYGAIIFVAFLLIAMSVCCYYKFKPPSDDDDQKKWDVPITGYSSGKERVMTVSQPNETVKEVNEAKYTAVKKDEKVVMTKMVILNNTAAPIHDEEQKKAFAKMVILNNASRIHDEKQKVAYLKLMMIQNPHLFEDEIARHTGKTIKH